MMLSEKKSLKTIKFHSLLDKASCVWFIQCEQFQTKDLQKFKNNLKNELMIAKLDDSKISFELVRNKLAMKSILLSNYPSILENLSVCFQGPTLLCILSPNKKNHIHSSEDIIKLMQLINNKISMFSLKAIQETTESLSINKPMGVLLQGFLLLKSFEQINIVSAESTFSEGRNIIPLSLWDYKSIDHYKGNLTIGITNLLSILKTQLLLS